MVLITIVTGANLNQLITEGPHIAWQMRWSWGGAPSEATLKKGILWWTPGIPSTIRGLSDCGHLHFIRKYFGGYGPVLSNSTCGNSQLDGNTIPDPIDPISTSEKASCCTWHCGCATVLLYSWHLKGPTTRNPKNHVPYLQWWTPIGNTGGMDGNGSVHISVTETGEFIVHKYPHS